MSNYLYTSKGNNDEYKTPEYAITPLLEYVNGKIVWCPFDLPDSNFVKLLSKTNTVIHSHISDGKDFFNYEPENWDVIISNPPFTNKKKFFERALMFKKPFALLMTISWLNDAGPKRIFKDRGLQLMLFDKRVHFADINGIVNKRTNFSSAYYCWNFLPKQIVIVEL